jgi:hypothetical protein
VSALLQAMTKRTAVRARIVAFATGFIWDLSG